MYTEQEIYARYIVACINKFALQKKLDRRASFRYLYNHKGIQFLKDHYEIEHTLSTVVFEKLHNEDTGLYLEGSLYIYDLLKNELANGVLVQEEI